MSQTVLPAAGTDSSGSGSSGATGPTSGGPSFSGTVQARLASASAALRHALAGTPGRLRLISALAVLATLLAALGGGAALRQRSGALNQAAGAATHLVLLQSVQTKLVQADADATNSFLGFGLEPEAQRLDYIASIRAASRDLAVAAQASAADGAALGQANAALTRYTGFVASARANNRQGLPVGANYLKTASSLLRTDIVPELEARSTADQGKIKSAYSRAGNAGWWLAFAVIVGLAGLIGAQVFLSLHSRRLINVPLAAATVGLLVAMLVAAGVMTLAQSRANTVRHGALADATALSISRVGAFHAKSNESLTLISRGSGTPADPEWTTAFKTARSALPSDLGAARAALDGYGAQHQEIRKSDLNGDWDGAVRQAIATGKASANAQFQSYAQATEQALNERARATSSGLDQAGFGLLPVGIFVVLVGLLAAVGAWLGISLRLDEYR